MATGTTKQSTTTAPEDPANKEFVEKGSVSAAQKWCEDCRSILGLGATGNARQMQKSINHVSSGLEKLDSIAPYGLPTDGLTEKLTSFEQDFKAIAWDLELLRAQYREFEAIKKKAKRRSSDKKNASKNMEQKKREIEAAILKLQTLESELKAVADKEARRQKTVLDGIKSKPEGKEILAVRKSFGKDLVKLRKLAELFAKKYDTDTATRIAADFQAASSLNWLKLDSTDAAKAELTNIQNTLNEWVKCQKLYTANKKVYRDSVKKAQSLMERAEMILPPEELTAASHDGFLDRFARAEQAEIARQWDVAGNNVNAAFVTDLEKRVNALQSRFDIWVKIKEQTYPELKSKLENLTVPEYRLVGLQLIAEAVALGDQSRNYEAAAREFNTANEQAEQIVTADRHYADQLKSLNSEIDRLTILANKVSDQDAQKFAIGFPDEIASKRDHFVDVLVTQAFASNHVPTADEIDSVHSTLLSELKWYERRIADLAEPSKVAALEQALKDNKDIRPLLTELAEIHRRARVAAMDFRALGLEATSNPTGYDSWDSTLQAVPTWLQRRERDLTSETEINYEEVAAAQAEYKTKLATIEFDATDASIGATSEIQTAREELAQQLKKLKGWLKAARATTLREATWHGAAVSEAQQMEALLKTDNKAVLVERKERAEELLVQCQSVIGKFAEDVSLSPLLVIAPEWLTQYGDLKKRLQKMIKDLNDKKLKQVLPRESERYAGSSGVVVQAREELREDGPGFMQKKGDDWEQRVADLEAEVKTSVFDISKQLLALRKTCDDTIKERKERISGELCNAVQVATGEVVLGPNLPLWGELLEAQGYLANASTVERYNQIIQQLKNIDTKISWAIEDIQAGAGKQFVDMNDQVEQANRNKLEATAKYKARYGIAKEAFEAAKKSAKTQAGLDKDEYKKYNDLYKAALGEAKKANWAEACKKMDLASRLMKMLNDNPMGSQVTGRGQEHLKELNVRWVKSIETLNKSLTGLGGAIQTSCEGSDGLNTQAIVSKFDGKVIVPVGNELQVGAFQRELLVLQGKVPSKRKDRRKDLDNKKKYREQALSKVRRYQHLIQKNPMYQTVMFQSNPWRQAGGTVNALELMRAINDIDLNVQRGVG